MNSLPTVGIVGAGLSGLMAARTLLDEGYQVTLFDKGRRPGGRANTREHGSHRFDHGAQFFTVRDPAIRTQMAPWLEAGIVKQWLGRIVLMEAGWILPAEDSVRYVGVPGMVALPEHVASDMDVRSGVEVGSVTREGGRWTFTDADGGQGLAFDFALITAPAPQAVALLSGAPKLQHKAASVKMAPCWAAMISFKDRLKVDFDGAFITGSGLSWIARNNSKPGRPEAEAWVLHGTPDWTLANWALPREAAADELLEQLGKLVGPLPDVTFKRAHRWAYALPSGPVPGGALFDAAGGIGACGDWCLDGRVEGAMQSGIRLAQAFINQQNLKKPS